MLQKDKELMEFFEWLSIKYPATNYVTFATPRIDHHGRVVSDLLKKTGLKAGMPDIMIAKASGEYHGLFLHMKRPAVAGMPEGRLTNIEHERSEALKEQGYEVLVAYGAQEAIMILEEYFAHALASEEN